MRIPTPFVLIRVTRDGAARFQAVLDDLRGAGHTPWGRWVLEAIPRTHAEPDNGETTYWFRADGDPGDLPGIPAPGIMVYAAGGDAPTETDPGNVHDAQLLLGAVLARFVRRLAEGGGAVTVATPVTTPATEPAQGPDPEPDSEEPGVEPDEAEPETAWGPDAAGRNDPGNVAEYPIYQGVTMRTAREPGGWRLTFRRGDLTLLTTIERVPPWAAGVREQRRLATALGDTLVGEGTPNREAVGARLIATFATLLEAGVGTDDPATTAEPPVDAPDPDVVAEAVEILHHGDPVSTMIDTYAAYHEGDREVALALALTTACQSVVNASGVHVQLSGEPGSGKSHSVETWLDLLPDECKISGSFSDRALFYANLTTGPLIYIDDQDISTTLQEIIKISTTHYQQPTQHMTVTTERKPETLLLPARTAFVFSKVEGCGDDQILDRCLYAWVDQSDEHQARVTAKTLEIAALPKHLRERQRRGVDVCRAIWREIRGRTFDVTVPFARRIRFGGLKGRSQNLFLDLVRAFAVIRFEQRPYSVDPDDGTVVTNAAEADFHDAVRAFTAFTELAGSQVQKLTPAEHRCIDAIITWGASEFTRARLISATGLTHQRVHQILHGRKDRGGGLLAKCPALNVVKMTLHGEERSVSQNSYRVDLATLKGWMGYPIITLTPEDGGDRSTRSTPDQPPINRDVLIGQRATIEVGTTINHSNGDIICTCTDRSTICEKRADQSTGGVNTHTRSMSDCDSVCVRSATMVDHTPGHDLVSPPCDAETVRTPASTVRSRSNEMVDRGLIGGRSGVDHGLMHPLPGLIDPAEFSRAGSDHVDCSVCGQGCASRGGAFRSRDGLTIICGHCLDRELARESRRAGVA